jgi:hypothetical protein
VTEIVHYVYSCPIFSSGNTGKKCSPNGGVTVTLGAQDAGRSTIGYLKKIYFYRETQMCP